MFCKTPDLKKQYLATLENFVANKLPPLVEGKSMDGEGKKSTDVSIVDVKKIFRHDFKIKG